MTTLEQLRAEIEAEPYISKMQVLDLIDEYAEQEQETTVSVLPDKNGYYPNVCGMCANAESELCDWCSGNNNFKKTTTKIPDFYKKYAEQEPMREFTEEEEAKAYSKALDKIYKSTGFNVFNEPCNDEWKDGYDMAWKLAEVFYEKEEPTSPCDLCKYNCKDICCLNCPAIPKGGE